MTKNNLNIAIIPLDDRPVSYSLPEQISAIKENINIFLPPRDLLGNLQEAADIGQILEWLRNALSENTIDYVICALDTIAYGGLIPSRKAEDSKEVILSRLDEFKQVLESSEAKLLAFSSIMRVSDSNDNQEEKPYWDKYGKLLFKYSCYKHKGEDYSTIEPQIPANILDDYLKTRERNFSINKTYLEWQKQDIFEFLLFSKDDTAPYGLNVAEAEELQQEACVHTGADEVISLLLARAISDQISILPVYSTPNGGSIIPRYEDRPLMQSVEQHITICNAEVAEAVEEADLILLLHTPQEAQNDYALGEYVEKESPEAVDFCVKFIERSQKPVILADVADANGADNLLVQKLFKEKFDLYGYAGWNTASNTIGTALAMGIMRYISEKENVFSNENFKKLMFIRFADDWAYQANIRQIIRQMAQTFDFDPSQINITFPWNRFFEIEINS